MKRLFTAIRSRLAALRQRRGNRFINRLEEQALLLVQGTEALIDYMQKPSKKNAKRVSIIEKQADEVRRIFIDELNRTFVTPIDREDLFALSRSIDDVLDIADSITKEMDALRVDPNQDLRTMTDMLHKIAQEILLAIQRLEHHPNVATTHVIRIKNIQNDADTFYTEALGTLYKKDVSNLNEMLNILKLREMYRELYHAVNTAEETGDIISHVVVKFY